MDMDTIKFRDIACAITDDRSLSADDLLFLIDYVLDYLDEYNMHPSYEYLRAASDHLFFRAFDDFLCDHYNKEGGE